MLQVAVTGGIGSGKSTVVAAFAGLGAFVVDADQLAREVVAPGTPGLRSIVDRFGKEILDGEALDRAGLARIVFADRSALHDLEQITHPLIRQRYEEIVSEAPSDSIIIHEVPLLVEKDLARQYQLTINVETLLDVRRARLEQRGLTPSDIDARLGLQVSDEERRSRCDVTMTNNEEPSSLQNKLHDLWRNRIKPFGENLALNRLAPRQARAEILPYQSEWPNAAARLIERLEYQLPDAHIAHVGSTSVPGLGAKDVIDIQVSVSELNDRYDDPMRRAGFVLNPDVNRDVPRPSAAEEVWAKRFYQSCDPARPANVHMRVFGSPGERYALLFPQWLRAHAEAARDYEEFKRELAMGTASTGEYAEAKEGWFSAAEADLLKWAEGTGALNQLR